MNLKCLNGKWYQAWGFGHIQIVGGWKHTIMNAFGALLGPIL